MRPPLRFPEQLELLQLWSRKRGPRAMPCRSELSAAELRSWLGHMHLLEVIDQGEDFRYLVFGTEIARRYDVEMTRRRVSEWPEPMRMAELDAYRRVVREACPYLVRQNEGALDRLFASHRLLLPLSRDGSTIDHILTHLRMLPGDQEESGIHYHAIARGPAA